MPSPPLPPSLSRPFEREAVLRAGEGAGVVDQGGSFSGSAIHARSSGDLFVSDALLQALPAVTPREVTMLQFVPATSSSAVDSITARLMADPVLSILDKRDKVFFS